MSLASCLEWITPIFLLLAAIFFTGLIFFRKKLKNAPFISLVRRWAEALYYWRIYNTLLKIPLLWLWTLEPSLNFFIQLVLVFVSEFLLRFITRLGKYHIQVDLRILSILPINFFLLAIISRIEDFWILLFFINTLLISYFIFLFWSVEYDARPYDKFLLILFYSCALSILDTLYVKTLDKLLEYTNTLNFQELIIFFTQQDSLIFAVYWYVLLLIIIFLMLGLVLIHFFKWTLYKRSFWSNLIFYSYLTILFNIVVFLAICTKIALILVLITLLKIFLVCVCIYYLIVTIIKLWNRWFK